MAEPAREQIAIALYPWIVGSAMYDAADAVLALLSQPTPTAERDDLLSCLELSDDGNYHWDTDALDRLLERRMNELPAAPPRIADMVPGTTFTGRGAPNMPWHRYMAVSGGDVVAIDERGGIWREGQVDPSTIRDVTPPAVTS